MKAAHTIAWKKRLLDALTSEPRSTGDLAAQTAVPRPQASKLLDELYHERLAMKTPLPRTRNGGNAPDGWCRREAQP